MEPTTFVLWVLGLSVTGFFFLAGWCKNLTEDVKKLSLSVIANDVILKELQEIKKALIGDVDNAGIITRIHDHTRDINSIKEICREKHQQTRV